MAESPHAQRGPSARALRAFLVPYFLAAVAAGGLAGRQCGFVCASTDIVRFNVDPALLPFFVYALAAIGMMTGALVANLLWQLILRMIRRVWAAPALDRAVGAVGFTVGVAVGSAFAIPLALSTMETAGLLRALVIVGMVAMFGAAGALLLLGMREQFVGGLPALSFGGATGGGNPPAPDESPRSDPAATAGSPKLLDTSVIIDGRIHAVCKTGFVEGALILPAFVLEELQTVADCADPVRRRRGRRGLVLLNKMQKEYGDRVCVLEDYGVDIPDTDEVDIQLVHLAKAMQATIISNDFNLSRVAELHGVSVLNINMLAAALKPVHLHGEEIEVMIVKEGREPGQGVAYLEDGTMVVIEGAAHLIGNPVRVTVTSMIQTVAGKMVFAALSSA